MGSAFEPEILQDFLTESGELLEKLEGDLVVLEQDPRDPEMLNQVFRALHTIKGSASFLGLTNLVRIAHAAESALNAARNRVIVVDKAMMDLLLQASDTIKRQMSQLSAGEDLCVPDETLVRELTLIGDGKSPSGASAAVAPANSASAAAPAAAAAAPAAPAGSRPLVLDSSKADLLEYLIADLNDSLARVDAMFDQLQQTRDRAAGHALAEASDALARSVEFFECSAMSAHTHLLAEAAEFASGADDTTREQLLPRIGGLIIVLHEQTEGLKSKLVLEPRTATLVDRVRRLISGGELTDGLLPGSATPQDALVADGVHAAAAAPAPDHDEHITVPSPADTTAAQPAADHAPAADKSADKKGDKHAAPGVEQTIRVEVGRLETLMNLVGELVLQKNRIAAITRQIQGDARTQQTMREAIGTAAGGLDRVTADIQIAVMRTRMQPLDKLFGKYPRLIRDLAAKTQKKIDLVIEGGDTEVDKSVIEELGDPLVHLLRNSADHGIETPAERVAAGKPETGTLRLVASHEGGHVRVQVIDDGRGLNRERIVKKAIERGLTTQEAADALSEREVFRFIFLPGFSTAEKVSDLSGRGVGMDVVKTNIEKLKGSIELDSTPGHGTTINITIPLTVAILPAMMVSISKEIYAIPLTNILEIVRPGKEEVTSIGGHSVMRLRDSVLPLVNGAEVFSLPGERPDTPFAVVLSMNDKRVGLMVTGLIGQQEIVVKPLDDTHAGAEKGPVSGATVRDDGGVSLIVDVAELLKLAESKPARGAMNN
ncbi:MAG: chemotaxis protein CheA [Planctomycetota bacterium]|nr:chemotaxis protein CheA [Planctomycetota bacterium]